MATRQYLAMTAAEIANNPDLPPNIGWMACHFSPYGTGLSNMPPELPEESLLILNDRTPIHGHDPEQIAAQLCACMEELHCAALLLDFQRPDCEETKALIKFLLQAIKRPVVVSDVYAEEQDCPVFLPPVPPSVGLETYFSPWKSRDIWLEIGLDGEQITLTEQGSISIPLPHLTAHETGFSDSKLHCHYKIDVTDTQAQFTLWRSKEDLEDLLSEAEAFGIAATVGLFQELSF